jgi:hypothetical protein
MTIDVVVDGPGVPKTLVEKAVSHKRAAEKLARQENDDSVLFDEVWCVFDVDDHVKIPDAKQQAKANQISLAISNPCFELWALLHYQSQTAHITRQKLARLLQTHIPGYEKLLPVDDLEPRYPSALKRGMALEKDCERLGEPGKNPSTGVHHLAERIRGAKTH